MPKRCIMNKTILNTLTTRSRHGRLRNRYDCYQEPTRSAQAILGYSNGYCTVNRKQNGNRPLQTK